MKTVFISFLSVIIVILTETIVAKYLLVEVDQNITSNENIITVETDKASIDVPSDKTGKIHSVKVKVGDYIKKGDILEALTTNGIGVAAANNDDDDAENTLLWV